MLVECRVGGWLALVVGREREMMRLMACEKRVTELEKRLGLEVMRWVVTHSAGGIRQLTLGMQGRWTFETREAAEAFLDGGLFRREIAKVIGPSWETLEVRPWPCWPEHFDPKTCWGEFELFWWETWMTSWSDQPSLKGGWDGLP